MAGTYTHSRRIPTIESGFCSHKSGSPRSTFNPGLEGVVEYQDQVTTSYRTGKRGSMGVSLEDQEDGLLLSGGPSAFTLSKLRRSYDHRSEFDNGHEFSTIKRLSELPSMAPSRSPLGYDYTGPVRVLTTLTGPLFNRATCFPTIPVPDVSGYGVMAVNKTRPTMPLADLAVTLAELRREGFPRIPGAPTLRDRTKIVREAGSQYLNVEFGWRPLVSEVMAAINAVGSAGKVLRQYQRDSGKNVRRRYRFPEERTSKEIGSGTARLGSFNGSVPADSTAFWTVRDGPFTLNERTEKRVWFSGAYTYHLQSGGSLFDKLTGFEQRVNRLFGTRVTPEVLWNLAPWSWLSDWNFTIGAHIANASALASDGLVLRYGYIMVETTVIREFTVRNTRLNNETRPSVRTFTFTTVKKERFRASPFGFAQNPSTYSARQWAILGALGMTKAPNVLP